MKKNSNVIDQTCNHMSAEYIWKYMQLDEWLEITVYPSYKYAFDLIRIALSEGCELTDAEGGAIEIDCR